MRIKTSELSGAALDWAVARIEGATDEWRAEGPFMWEGVPCVRVGASDANYHPAADWSQGGPIIEREGISWHCGNKTSWHAYGYGSADNFSGPTPLIAAMRCYVASKLGDEVDVPGGLV